MTSSIGRVEFRRFRQLVVAWLVTWLAAGTILMFVADSWRIAALLLMLGLFPGFRGIRSAMSAYEDVIPGHAHQRSKEIHPTQRSLSLVTAVVVFLFFGFVACGLFIMYEMGAGGMTLLSAIVNGTLAVWALRSGLFGHKKILDLCHRFGI